MRIFRDERHLRPGVDLPELIRSALESSEFLILLASPEAAASPWVTDEIDIWCRELGRASNLIVVLTGGTAELPGIAPEFQRLIGVPVRVGDPLVNVKLGKKVGSTDHVGSLATAIGLGIEV